MSIICPICQIIYFQIPPNLCPTCGWSLSTSDDSIQTRIDWVKQLWSAKQVLELRAKQAESVIADQQNQIDDRHSRIDLLQKRLERLTLEKEQALTTAREQQKQQIFQLETKITQLQQTVEITHSRQLHLQKQLEEGQIQIQQLQQQLQQTMAEKSQIQGKSTHLQAEIAQLKHEQTHQQNQLGDRQKQIQALQHQLQQVNSEKEQAQDITRKLEGEANRLQKVLLFVETDYDTMCLNKQNLLQELQDANKQLKQLTQQEQIAKVAISQWLQSDLLDRLIEEIVSIGDRTQAIEKIKRLQDKRLNQQWQDFPVHCIVLQVVIDSLGQVQEPKAKLQAILESSNVFDFVDAVLGVRAELKFHRIIQRDGTGDYFHGL